MPINYRLVAFPLTVISICLIAGCTIMDSNALVTGNPRPAVSPNNVMLYSNPPPQFEEIAVVFASAGHDFLSGGKLMNSAVERLKSEAAKLGANGVILTQIKERDSGSPSIGVITGQSYGSVGISNSQSTYVGISRGDSHTRVQGRAIYVSK
jgi:hypothetical protein